MKSLLTSLCLLMNFNILGQLPPPTNYAIPNFLSNFIKVQDTFFIEKTEVSNQMWWEYYQAMQADSVEQLKQFLPDNQVWKSFHPHSNLDLHKYFGKKSFLSFPVVGITYEQALNYCKWRSEQQTVQFAQENQHTSWKDFEVSFHFRLPTEEEWLMQAQQLLNGRSVQELTKYIHTRKGTARRLTKATEPVTARQLGDRDLFHWFGNVAEMTSKKGIAKGGSWMKPITQSAPNQVNHYHKPTAWLGFRCVVAIEIRPKKMFDETVLTDAINHAAWFHEQLVTIDTAVYIPAHHKVKLPFHYESDAVSYDSLNYQLQHQTVTAIEIVFTRYPYHLAAWNINYYELLAQRLQNLFKYNPSLNTKQIQWNIIRQTACQSKEEASKLFHGFVLTTIPKVAEKGKKTTNQHMPYEEQIVRDYSIALDTFEVKKPSESIIQDYFEKFPERLDQALVVMDWTASMYPYACETILFNLKNSEKYKASHFSFFNDGDQKKNWQKKIGETGGIYFAPANEMNWVLATMKKAQEAGNGGDIPENDIEALQKSIQQYPNSSPVLLVADNQSPIRDDSLMQAIDQPIHVILCGIAYEFFGKKIHILNPQYYHLARQHGGSLYFEGYERYHQKLGTALPTLSINHHTYWVLDDELALTGQGQFNFMFRGKTIELAHVKKETLQEIPKFIEFNQANFPKLIELNKFVQKKKDKVYPKKTRKAKN